MGEFDVDIYAPFFSELGIPTEELMKLTTHRDGFTVLIPEALLILKQNAYKDRRGSSKGEKGRLDILALATGEMDLARYVALAKQYKLENLPSELRNILEETRDVPELNINEHAFWKVKRGLLSDLA